MIIDKRSFQCFLIGLSYIYSLIFINCLYTIRKMSSKSVTNKLAAPSGLNIVEKYSFRGRRKYNNETLSEEAHVERKRKSETKVTKIATKTKKKTVRFDEKSSIKEEENQSELVEKPTDVDKKKVKSVKPTKTVKKIKNSKSVIKSETSDIDIENCDEVLNDGQEKENVEEKVKWVPKNWEAVLKNIREMRKDATAPVDDMGCHKTMDDNASPKDKRYQALVSLMLSSQTKDQITFATMLKLREHGLTVDNILKTDEDTLANLIKAVGFWRTKAKHIKKTTQILKEEYDGDIPDTVEKMLKLPGVGPKMANLCMTTAWGKVHGIGVDTHVHRISNRLKWVPKPTTVPEQTRIALERWLPHALWYEVNHLMVGFGQQICLPRNPKCGECLNNKICPFGISELKGRNKKKKE